MLAALNLAVCRLRSLGRFFRITRDVVNGGSHLVHRRGDLLGFFLLTADFKIGLLSHG
ncbi:hypothetical protein D3C86_1789680 [compost metagenome]